MRGVIIVGGMTHVVVDVDIGLTDIKCPGEFLHR